MATAWLPVCCCSLQPSGPRVVPLTTCAPAPTQWRNGCCAPIRCSVTNPPPPPQRLSWPTAASAREHSEADCAAPDCEDQLLASSNGNAALEGGDGSSSRGGGRADGGAPPRLPPAPNLHGKTPRRQWNANALAFLGDSVWEVGACCHAATLLLVMSSLPALAMSARTVDCPPSCCSCGCVQLYARRRFFYPPTRKDSYFGQVVHHVRAETQVAPLLPLAAAPADAARCCLVPPTATCPAICAASPSGLRRSTDLRCCHAVALGSSPPQERMYHELLASGFLTAEEQDVLRWGRNATGVCGADPTCVVAPWAPSAADALVRVHRGLRTWVLLIRCTAWRYHRRDAQAAVGHVDEAGGVPCCHRHGVPGE